jgi:purine-binding chemotaxis protein CheW
MSPSTRYASCRVGDFLIGVDVERVQEVNAGSRLTPVPLAPPLVSGLLNLRGEIVAAIDLRRCLQLAERPPGQPAIHVIVRIADGSVSLLVDDVGDVLTVDADALAPLPPALRERCGDLMTGGYALDGGMLLALDVDGLLTVSSGDATAANRRMTC